MGESRYETKIEESILKPLEEKIRKDMPLQEEQKGYITALKFLASNPHSLREFAEWVLTGTYRGTTLTSFEGRLAGTFRRLGVGIINGYSIDAVLEGTGSEAFKSLHSCHPIGRKMIRKLKDVLGGRRLLYPGDVSEHVARATINAHLEFLFDLKHFISSILELWLARSTSEYQAVMMERTDGNRSHRTYLTGRTDYMVLTITSAFDGLTPTYVAEKDRKKAFKKLDLENLKGPIYSELADHLAVKLNVEQDWEALFIEAKSTALFSQGKVNMSDLYQIITTCCIARSSGRKAHKVFKFALSSGHHWIFGVMDNSTVTAYVTAVLDNSDFRRTHNVICLLVLWMVLPGLVLKDHLFAKLTPQPLLPNIGAKSESQTGAGTNEDTIPKAGDEEGDQNKDEGNSAKGEGSSKVDPDDEGEDSGAEVGEGSATEDGEDSRTENGEDSRTENGEDSGTDDGEDEEDEGDGSKP